MSYAAEPYGVFVDDLLSNLTGGVTRETYVFLPENAPFRLGFGKDFLPSTLRAHGIAGDDYQRFRPDIDFTVDPADGTLTWLEGDPGVPAAGATWPDRGTRFYVGYERKPESHPPPLLTDRNPGSVVRTLAESFAREFAVVSRQLELVYDASFLETATGRDLDQLALLLGIARRSNLFASGEVVFSRTSPASADITIAEGTRVSTAEAPIVTVETGEARTLRTGTLSVAAPVRAMVEGVAGVAPARSLVVLNRAIFGVAGVENAQALRLGGPSESDEELRRRIARALETSGRATIGAIKGALAALDGIAEKDIRIEEDFLAAPGVLKVTVAASLSEAQAKRAAEALDAVRPAGIRVIHNLPVTPLPSVGPGEGGGGGGGETAPGVGGEADGTFMPIGISAKVTPTAADLPAAEKNVLKAEVEAALRTAVEALGIGEAVVYNRLVAAVMGLETVYDVLLELYPAGAAASGRQNLPASPPSTRARLDELEVTIRGALIALDVVVQVQRLGLAASGDSASALATIRDDIALRLGDTLAAHEGAITPEVLQGGLSDTETYSVQSLGYTAEFLEEGLQIRRANVTITPGADQEAWIRAVQVTEEVLA